MTDSNHKWTEDEDQILKATVHQGATPIDWLWVAEHLPERSNKDCRKRWYQKFAGNTNFGSWMDTEDNRLRAAVAQHGTKWPVVSREVGTRTSDQCSKRWKQVLDPSLDHSPWSLEEDSCLLVGVEQLGRNWKLLSEMYFKNRAALSLKNRHALLIRRKNKPKELSRNMSGLQMTSRSHSPDGIDIPQFRTSRDRQENLPTTSDVDREFGKEFQDKEIASDFSGDILFNQTTSYDWRDLQLGTPNAIFKKENSWPRDADIYSSSSPCQDPTTEALSIGHMFEELCWGANNETPMHKSSMPGAQDNFEGLMEPVCQFETGSFPIFPTVSLSPEETSERTSSGLNSQISNSPENTGMPIPTARGSGTSNEQLTTSAVPYRGKDWNNLFNLSIRCTKRKMDAIRQSVFEATNEVLCIEETDDDLIEMRLKVDLRS